ncbi:EAL domain-containing protein [Oceanibaculum nanhaiense]|uniref:EAL domain-containing protein n=1 Tax=Oceanibaculum nanhaiense TaxID=1909734 RepID=UPI000A3C106C|nr:EAL domain-containing protein [Oceanibaculum nanhaiense]
MCIAALAGAAALLLPVYVPMAIDPAPLSLLGAALILVFGLGLQATLLISSRNRRLARQMAYLARDHRDMRETLDILGQRMDELISLGGEETPARDLSEVVAEVRVLQTLIEELWTKRGDEPAGGELDEAELAEAEILPPAARGKRVLSAARDTDDPMLNPREILEIVREGLRDNRIEIMMQPVVTLPQRRVIHYECLSRIRTKTGLLITPDHYIGIAEEEGLIGAIDNMTLFRLVQHVRRHRGPMAESRFFCNISNRSLEDSAFFEQFSDFLTANASLAQSIVFEFAQEGFPADPSPIRDKLLVLAEAGYRFSLDHITDLDIDPEEFAALGFKFLKIDASLLLSYAEHEPPLLDIGLLKGALDRVAMDLIVEHVENDDMLLRLLDHPVDFGQGYLFGGPMVEGRRPR